MDMEERKARGLLWTDTGEAMEEQSRARGRAYDFNHLRPEEKEKRIAMLPEMFGSVGENVWIEPPIIFAFGKTVAIGANSVIGAGSVVTRDIPADTLAMGVPCRVVRKIDDHDLEYYYHDRRTDENDVE